jgi:alanyl-tRNA synthetase
MGQQRQRARQAQKSAASNFVPGDIELPATDDSAKYQTDSCTTKIVGWIDSEGFHTEGSFGIENTDKGENIGIVLQQTCFYAESGGQIGDFGVIKSSGSCFSVERTEKTGDCVSHWGKFTEGTFNIGQRVEAVVSKDRDATKKNHTATHLLQWALQQTLGESVAQQGSLVCPEYLRFDFTYPQALTDEQIKKVEHLVEEKIVQDLPVICKTMPKSQADKLGAMALFGQKYGNEVRVVAVGAGRDDGLDKAFSKEFCGGTHVGRIGSIGGFKIIKEESISSGVRRITALTGQALAGYLEQRGDIVNELSEMLKVPAEEVVDRVSNLIKDNKRLSKELKSAARQSTSDIMAEAKQLLKQAEKIGETLVIISRILPTSPEQARAAIDMLKKKAKSAAVVFGFADKDKVTLLVAVTDDLVKKGLKAGDIVKQIAPIVDGGGGGRPQMAQAGGKNPKRIDDALAKAAEIIKEKLAG